MLQAGSADLAFGSISSSRNSASTGSRLYGVGVGLAVIEPRSLGEIARPSINSQLAVSLAMGLDFDGVITLYGTSRGVVRDGVLVSYISSNLGSHRIDILQRPREEGDPSGLVRERLQVMPGMARLVSAEEEANGSR